MKPTRLSVTSRACRCGFFGLASKIRHPVQFDERLQQYQLESVTREGRRRWLVLYHCPICGGCRPSFGGQERAVRLSWWEKHRLRRLTSGIDSFDAAIRRLGHPDDVWTLPDWYLRAEVTQDSQAGRDLRTLHYSQLSETVNVDVVEQPDGSVHVVLFPKRNIKKSN